MDAGHLLMVIDACNSGQALEAEEKRRGPMNSKGLAQLAKKVRHSYGCTELSSGDGRATRARILDLCVG
jgi:hypothetical protein